jgi:hypothetical protein
MPTKRKPTRDKTGTEQFYTKTVVVTLPDGKRKRVTFFADAAEHLNVLDELKNEPNAHPPKA